MTRSTLWALTVLVALGCVLPGDAAVAAELQAWVNQTRIEITDTVELAVRWDGDASTGREPDFDAAVGNDFEIRSRSQERQYSIVNGRASAFVTWRLTLKPTRTGTLAIRAMQLDTARSQSITIEVRPQSASARRELERLAFFDTTVSASTLPVQAQLLYTIRLHYGGGVQLFGELPQAPDIPDAIVQSLGAARPGEVLRDGRRMSVIEQRFAIFPQRTGRIELPPVSVSGSARIAGQRRRIEVSSEGHSVEVVSPPAPAPTPWLPASDVEILEAWSEEPPELTVGSTITRTVIVTARGQVASMLPENLPLVPDAVRHYPDPPVSRETATADGTVATRTFSAAVVPDSPGQLRLAPIEITWYDTDDNTVKVARLPARTLAVGGTVTRNPPTPGANVSTPATSQADIAPADVGPAPASPPSGADAWWMPVAVVCAVGWLGTLLAWWLTGRRRAGGPRAHTATRTTYDPEAALRALRRACRGRSARTAHAALAQWAAARHQCGAGEALARLRREQSAATPLRDLEAALYAPGERSFDGAALLAWVESLPPLRSQRADAATLPPLYPQAA